MKNFIKGKWFPLIAAFALLFLAAGIVFIMILFGWRFTYAPELETSWDAISAVASLVGAVGAIAAVCFSAFALRKQINLSQKQQTQNTALNLYPKRREVLRLFSEKKYDDIFWDATILFSEEIVDKIAKLSSCEKKYKKYSFLIDQYESEMKNTEPELYEQFQLLVSQADIDGKHDELLALCDGFKPFIDNPVDGGKIYLDYRNLDQGSGNARLANQALQNEIFLLMKDEIKKSIQ